MFICLSLCVVFYIDMDALLLKLNAPGDMHRMYPSQIMSIWKQQVVMFTILSYPEQQQSG